MADKHTMDLTTGSVFKKTIIFTLPIFLNGVLQQLYSAADTIIIGKYGSETALTGVLNVLLNLLFVIAFHVDIAGVALATIISQLVSAVLLVYILFRRKDSYRMDWHKLRLDPQDFKDMIAKGVPVP